VVGHAGHVGLEEWRKKKLDGLKKQEHTKLKKDQANEKEEEEEEEDEEELVKKTEMVEFNSHPPDHKSNVFKFMNPDEKGESIAAKLVRKKQG
jgi:ATP-dependent exoDNAse (exonuclease V) alpha subunit